MKFSVIEAKSYHVGQMVRRMRSAHRDAAMALGVDVHRDIRSIFDDSGVRLAWLADGKLMALGGVTGGLADVSGHLWLVASEGVASIPVAFLREAKKQFARVRETRHDLTTTLFKGDEPALRFAIAFGFRQVPGAEKDGMIRLALRPRLTVSTRSSEKAKDTDPFIIFALPRSRTAWLASFLSYGDWTCRHDAMIEADGWDGLIGYLAEPNRGICETGLVMAWPILHRRFPQAKIVVVRRAVDQVRESLAEHHWEFYPGHLEWMADRLDEISAAPATLTVEFGDLDTIETCKRVFEHCLDRPFDHEWWSHWAKRNVQIDMKQRLRRLGERRVAMDSLAEECQSLMSPITYQVERWDEFVADAICLFEQHRQEVGETPGLPFDLPFEPDFSSARHLDEAGSLQIMTARAGGKLVGYLFFIIQPHPESHRIIRGVQNTFFVRRGFRGAVGKNLHAQSVKALKAKGVDVLSLRSGVRGSGPKLAALYKRMGAVEDGRVYSLWIGGQ